MKVGLYFGTFNPIHIGHMAIANYMVEYANIDQLWFVVSPQSPHKKKQSMLADYHRLQLVNQATDDDPRMNSCNIEFSMPKPSYTIDTLTYLQEKYPNHLFSILMGSDNLKSFHKWKNYEQIIENYSIMVYPRKGFDRNEFKPHRNIRLVEAPIMEISSTFIRNAIKEGRDIRHFLPCQVWQYLDEMNFYKQ